MVGHPQDAPASANSGATGSGLEAGSRCAILAGNSPDWIAVYLGIVASGHTAVPLDTAFNAEQAGKLLRDCGASLIFVDGKNLPVARQASQKHPLKVVLIDDPSSATGAGKEQPASGDLPTIGSIYARRIDGFTHVDAKPDDVACILYTSGTTSDPKGVMLSHANLRGEMEAVFRFVRFDYTDAILGVLPLFHALAQMANLMIPLACGARVVFLESLNTSELLRALAERNVTLFCCVPQFFYLIHERIFQEARKRGRLTWAIFQTMLALSRAGRRVGLNPGKIFFKKVHTMLGPRMRYLVTGGSRFDNAIGRDFHALGFEILQAYGLTETTGGALVTPPEANVIGSIGKPLPGVEAKIINSEPAENVSGAATGEIAIRGPIVMKGYYQRPEATAEVIRDGWLHTGDLGYRDAAGNFFITGRKKEIIVLSSGKNIYPEEIESYYLKSPWIKEICVIGLESAPGTPVSERLHAVIVPDLDALRQKKVVNMREVIRYDVENISSQLPAGKRILSYDLWQQDLPRTTTRKLRRFEIEARVREQGGRGEQAGQQLARELTDEERQWMSLPDVQRALAVIRSAARNKREPGPPADAAAASAGVTLHPRDNLELDLGLDSMQRVELLVALEHQLGADVEDSAAAEVYTVRELVDLVCKNIGKGAAQAPGWEMLLAGESTDPEVLALINERPVAGLLWYLFGRMVNLFARDVFRLKISGLEKLPRKGAFIVCANHQSYLDAPILTAALPYSIFRNVFYVGTSELFGSGLARAIARFVRVIPVDPDANLVPAMRAGAYGLRHGKILMLYPEGERTIDGAPKSFKKGAAILARHLNVPIVPVAQEGFFDAWPRGRGFQKFAPLRIRIGDPIYPDPAEAPVAAYERLTSELRQRVVAMWEELRAQSLVSPGQATAGSAAAKH
jgi:long-chain acyl-CoA synthetase